jgi:uncharacterized protein
MIGRDKEQTILKQCLLSKEAEMIAVLGRRRVGKTYLIRNTYKEQIKFELVGKQNGKTIAQLSNFKKQLKEYFPQAELPTRLKNWDEALDVLKIALVTKKYKSKIVLFFDEVPWLAESSKKRFIESLGYFWNSWAVINNIVLVLCGSSASWIVNQIVNSKGGLHNRLTKKIFLKPFTLTETKKFLNSNNVLLDEYDIIKLYMIFGGIPHYLKQVMPHKSIDEVVQETCFDTSGLLHNEFDNLYKALFNNAEQYISIIRALSQMKSGLDRQDLIKISGVKDGGSFTKYLNDLVLCDFIIEQSPSSQLKKDIVYRVVDEFSLFYINFIEGQNTLKKNYWQIKSKESNYKIWCGHAFENVCFRHQDQIVYATGLHVINTSFSSFYHKATEVIPGLQVDMVLDRADNAINLFEIKFYNEPLIIDKKLANQLREKVTIFKAASNTRKQVSISMISVFGTIENTYSKTILAHNLKALDLFF